MRLAVTGAMCLAICGFSSLVNGQATEAVANPSPGTMAANNQLQEVTVSASAISIAGYEAPTPITSVSAQQIESDARPDIGDVIRNLPAFMASPSPYSNDNAYSVSSGIQGLDLVNLRNLGVLRTLVLFDGQRVPASNLQGGVDLGTIPSSLVERIDAVTGGASAVWGSDALAGVVNLIINKNFNGAQIDVETGNNSQGLHRTDKVEITLGTAFDDNRGHIEVAGDYWDSPQPYYAADIPGFHRQALVSNPACSKYVGLTATCPAGQPIWLHANDVGLAKATTGGLITSALNGQPSPLNNIAFGLNGAPYNFNPGNVTEGFYSNGGTLNDSEGTILIDAVPIKSETAFLLTSFKLTDAVTASLQLNYGHTNIENESTVDTQYGNVPIYSGNPYIPASVQAQMTAQGITGVLLGTTNMNNVDGGGGSLASEASTLGIGVAAVHRTLMRGVFTLDGTLGSKWAWNAYYMHGQAGFHESALNNVDVPNLKEAENAVLVTPAMSAATGLAAGSITCAANVPLSLLPGGATGLVASTAIVAGATPGCQPLNVMGVGVASQAAMNYIKGPTLNGLDSQTQTFMENVASASLQGQLPFGTEAGPVAAAAGVLYRSESGVNINCGVNCNNVRFYLMNFASFYGRYNIKEANAEVNAPLLKDQGVKSLSIDAAARVSDYSTSGTVETYKFGVVSQLTDALRLRASYSYDIRAPALVELFSQATALTNSLVDPRTNVPVQAFSVTSGNRALKPEIGETRSAGFIFTPVQGLTASIDWYYIIINGAIGQGFAASKIIAECVSGVSIFCPQLVFGTYPNGCTGPTLSSCPAGPLAAVLNTPLNSNRQTTSGLDFNADYRAPFMSGALDLSTAMNYAFEERYTSLGTTFDALNSIGFDVYTYSTFLGAPKFRGNVSATYAQGPWLGTIQTRMIGATHLLTNWTSGVQVDNNDIPFYWYFDLRLSYKWPNGIQLYGAVDDVLNRIQPILPCTPNGCSDQTQPDRGDTYDGFGRVWRVGIRARF